MKLQEGPKVPHCASEEPPAKATRMIDNYEDFTQEVSRFLHVCECIADHLTSPGSEAVASMVPKHPVGSTAESRSGKKMEK
jgi:hypothetical protein